MKSGNPGSNSVRIALCAFAIGFLVLFIANRSLHGDTRSAHRRNHPSLGAPPTIVLATGLPDGDYIRLGHAIARVAADSGLNIQVCSSQGSNKNLELLKNEKYGVNFALVQSDALHEAVFHGPDEASDAKSISLVSYLYSEKVHLVLRPHFYLGSLSDLRQMTGKVWLGPKGSGTLATTERILEASGLTKTDIDNLEKRTENSWANAEQDLVSGDLQAFFRTRSTPPKNLVSHPATLPKDIPSCEHLGAAIKHVEKKGESTSEKDDDPIEKLLLKDARLVGLPAEIVDRMTEDGLYDRSAIPLATYPHLKRGVPTISLSTALVTNAGRNDPVVADLIGDLLDVIQENRAAIERDLGGIPLELLSTSLDEKAAEQWADHIQLGARDHLMPEHSWQKLGIQGSALAGIVLLCFSSVRKSLRKALAMSIYPLLLLTILAILWLAFSFGMVTVEGQFNPDFQTVFTSMRKMLAYISGWSGGKDTVTPQGRTILYFAVFAVPLVFGWLTSDVIHDGLKKAANGLSNLLKESPEKKFYLRKWARRFFKKTRASNSQPSVRTPQPGAAT